MGQRDGGVGLGAARRAVGGWGGWARAPGSGLRLRLRLHLFGSSSWTKAPAPALPPARSARRLPLYAARRTAPRPPPPPPRLRASRPRVPTAPSLQSAGRRLLLPAGSGGERSRVCLPSARDSAPLGCAGSAAARASGTPLWLYLRPGARSAPRPRHSCPRRAHALSLGCSFPNTGQPDGGSLPGAKQGTGAPCAFSPALRTHPCSPKRPRRLLPRGGGRREAVCAPLRAAEDPCGPFSKGPFLSLPRRRPVDGAGGSHAESLLRRVH